jgi:hypothetical protein
VYPDGTLAQKKPLHVDFECNFLFDFLRKNPGCGWLEAMGGADDYVLCGEPPFMPEERRAIERSQIQGEGWRPATDRFNDNDR